MLVDAFGMSGANIRHASYVQFIWDLGCILEKQALITQGSRTPAPCLDKITTWGAEAGWERAMGEGGGDICNTFKINN